MKNSLLYLILLTICVALPAAAQSSVTWTWAQQTGSTQRDGAAWTTAEAGGAVYQTGSFRGTITCGSATLTSVGVEDMYLVKYDGQGNVLWARQANNEPVMTSNSGAIGFALTTDGSGNVYVAGSFAGRVTFGNTVLTSPTSTVNSFIVKYNSQGTVQWARMAGGTSSTELRALAVDAANNLVVAGSFRGSTSFGGSTVTSRGDADVVLARLDAATGTTQWLQAAGSSQYDYVTHIAIGAGNAIIIAGGFSSVATFGAINVFSNGGTDGFLAQYNSQGTAQWAQGFGGPGNDSSIRVAVTPTNQIYSVGYFENTATLGAFTLVSQGSSDGYLLNADAQGTVLWARQMGGADSGGAYNLCLSATGAIYVSGRFRSTIVLDNQTLASAGGNDIFVARYDQSGLLAWATRAGGGLNDSDSGLAVNSAGMLYLGGIFSGTAMFGSLSLTSRGAEDAFLCQFRDNIPTPVRAKVAAEQLTLYPNPVDGPVLTVHVPTPPQEPATVDLFDAVGKRVKRLVLAPTSQHLLLDTHELAPGHYFLRYTTSKTFLMKSFTIR